MCLYVYIDACAIPLHCLTSWCITTHTPRTTVLWPFFRDHAGEPVPEENFWTLWCKGTLSAADAPTIRLGATPSGLTSAYLHHPPYFFTGRMPFLQPNQQRQSTEGALQIVLFYRTVPLQYWHKWCSAPSVCRLDEERMRPGHC